MEKDKVLIVGAGCTGYSNRNWVQKLHLAVLATNLTTTTIPLSGAYGDFERAQSTVKAPPPPRPGSNHYGSKKKKGKR